MRSGSTKGTARNSDFRIRRRTVDKENDMNEHCALKQLLLKSQRMSQMRNNYTQNTSSNSRKFNINKKEESRILISHDTVGMGPLRPLLGNHVSIPCILSNLNHKLIRPPNIHLWDKVAKQFQSVDQKKSSWQTLHRNLDARVNGQQCCFKIARRKKLSGYQYFIIVIKFDQKIHTSFNQKEWRKIGETYRTYQQIEECISLSTDNQIVLPINLDSEAISQHMKKSTENNDNLQFL